MHDQWPPHYASVFAQRASYYQKMVENPNLVVGAKEYYKDHIKQFINDWCIVYEPRNAGTDKPTFMPFVTFDKQGEFIDFAMECYNTKEHGLVEKCRTVGATWLACGISTALWLFHPGVSIGFGSNKANKVDELGNADSILEKIRIIIDYLPRFFWPAGFERKKHALRMKIINPENGSTITGEGGDNIGRGGRKAQPIDAPVLTPTGWRTIGALRTGDYVIGSDGTPTAVTGTQDHGCRRVYKVVFDDGTSTECDADHLWRVRDKLTRKNMARANKIRSDAWKVLPTSKLINSVYYGTNAKKELNYTIPIAKPIRFSKKDLKLAPYVMGVLLGDGSIKHIDRTVPSFVSVDAQIVDEVAQRLPEGVNLVSYKDGKTHALAFTSRGAGAASPVKAALWYYGVGGHGSLDKFIPDDYKFASIHQRHELLQGIMDADGYVGKRRGAGKVCISLSSERLIDDVRWIVQSLGGTARKTVRQTSRADSYTLTINIPAEFNPFKLRRKAERVGARTKYRIRRAIKEITQSRVVPVRCISVAANDGLYLTQACIVTHNSIYWSDEAAHWERPEQKEAALSETTDVQIALSSVYGTANLFARRRAAGELWEPEKEIPAGKTRVFVFDWRDHPHMTQEWYDKKRAKAEEEGLLHIFAQEIDRDYSAAVEGVLIPQQWVKAAIDAHKTLAYSGWDEGMKIAALDVADEGGDRNVFVMRKGVVVKHLRSWSQGDGGETTRKTITLLRELGCKQVQYDAVGVGSSVKAEYNRQKKENNLNGVVFVPWNGGAAPLHKNRRLITRDKESPLIKDFFANLKAQGWWMLRRRFEKTFAAVVKGVHADPSELISIPSELQERFALEQELSQPTYALDGKGKVVVNKKPDGSKSPDRADDLMMCFWPIQPKRVLI